MPHRCCFRGCIRELHAGIVGEGAQTLTGSHFEGLVEQTTRNPHRAFVEV
jgi:hypothetical protein